MANKEEEKGMSTVSSIIIRFVVTAVILVITSYFTPGFSITRLWSVILAAALIILVDYIIEKFAHVDVAPFGRGIIGFLITVAVLYFVQFLVPNMSVSLIGAVIAAVVIGVLDAIIPGRAL